MPVHHVGGSRRCADVPGTRLHQSKFFGALSKEFAERLAMVRAGKAFAALPAANGFGIACDFLSHIRLRPTSSFTLISELLMKRKTFLHGSLVHVSIGRRTTKQLEDNDHRSMESRHYVACQTCTVLSLLAEAIRVPSDDHATEVVHVACSS